MKGLASKGLSNLPYGFRNKQKVRDIKGEDRKGGRPLYYINSKGWAVCRSRAVWAFEHYTLTVCKVSLHFLPSRAFGNKDLKYLI